MVVLAFQVGTAHAYTGEPLCALEPPPLISLPPVAAEEPTASDVSVTSNTYLPYL